MGACVLVCGKKDEFMQEPQKAQIQQAVAEQIEKEKKEQLHQEGEIVQKQILVEVKNTQMTSSLTRSWKTQTRSRFYKQKQVNSQTNCREQATETIKSPSSCFVSDVMEKNISKRYNSKEISAKEALTDLQQSIGDYNKQNRKDENQVIQSQSINIKAKKKLILPKEGLTQTDKKLIQSTLNISTKTLINEKIKYLDGSIYLGQWKYGMRHGHGILTWSDGSMYEGEWNKNMVEGCGTLTYSQGQKYSGCFRKNQAHGKGQYCFSDGSKYVGQWVNSFCQGNGTEFFPNGQKFVGKWSNGKKNGYGQLEFEDGSYYKGEFMNNELHGEGVYNYGEKIYSGNWEHNEKCGIGCLQWSNGSRYEGIFCHDKMHGKGKFYDKNGSIFEGKWLNGRKEGIFTEYKPNGETVKGQWYFNKIIRQFGRKDSSKKKT